MTNEDVPQGDTDLVMRFRKAFADTLAAMPCDEFASAREMRSTAVTMMVRAALEELVAHIGTDKKALTYVLSEEMGRAIAERMKQANPRNVM